MKNVFLCLFVNLLLLSPYILHAQDNDKFSEQIKTERDSLLNQFRQTLLKNEQEIAELTNRSSSNVTSKDLEKLQKALDERLKTIEEAPKTRIKLNGQLALTELLSIQRDLQPAKLFSSSQAFFSNLSQVSNLQSYQNYNSWKTDYDKWYSEQKKDDQMISLVHNSLSLIGNVSSRVPLYGSFVQTATSGLFSLTSSFGKKHKDLGDKTPEMLKLLSAISQFEGQKAILDNEWGEINKELESLQSENDRLLREQLSYFGLDFKEFETSYLGTTRDSERDRYKEKTRDAFNSKIEALDQNPATKGKWIGQVEIYMYKVQSLRIRFGTLTSRMQSNLNRYEELIKVYSNEQVFAREFAVKINNLNTSLRSVKDNFSKTFKPEVYIEESQVMYIERNY